jgi:hypothetical protein
MGYGGCTDLEIQRQSALKMAALLDDKASAAEGPERHRQGDAHGIPLPVHGGCRIKTGKCTAAFGTVGNWIGSST